MREYYDYHFILREKHGYWSDKTGHLPEVKKYSQPPATIDRYSHIYQLQGYYLITNPYAKRKSIKKHFKEEEYGR